MEKIEEFTAPVGRGRYGWSKIAADGGVWKLRRGEDYPGPERNVVRAAYSWADRHNSIAVCHIPEEGVVEVQFTPKER